MITHAQDTNSWAVLKGRDSHRRIHRLVKEERKGKEKRGIFIGGPLGGGGERTGGPNFFIHKKMGR